MEQTRVRMKASKDRGSHLRNPAGYQTMQGLCFVEEVIGWFRVETRGWTVGAALTAA